MTYPEIVKALQRMKVETGSLMCFNCGREHNCSVHGCAIMREAADAITQLMAERNDAVACLKAVANRQGECDGCKHDTSADEGCGIVCDTGKNKRWQWRGPREVKHG